MGADLLVLSRGRALVELCVAVQTLQFNAAREKERGITLSVDSLNFCPPFGKLLFSEDVAVLWQTERILRSWRGTTGRRISSSGRSSTMSERVGKKGEKNGCESVLMVK